MKTNTYSTKEIAQAAGIHPNTVRFYEELGFITPPTRKSNGYRVYTELQMIQCKLVRVAMRAEVMQNGLRDKAIEIVRLCAKKEFTKALASLEEYKLMLTTEVTRARTAIFTVEKVLAKSVNQSDTNSVSDLLKRRDAAEFLHVTPETLRTWERSGLLSVKRSQNGYRAYNEADMERLNIIRTLRSANYSLASILRLLMKLDMVAHTEDNRKSEKNINCMEVSSKDGIDIEKVLNTPDAEEDIISVCDKLIISLENTIADTEEMKDIILKMIF